MGCVHYAFGAMPETNPIDIIPDLFSSGPTLPECLPSEPFALFKGWFDRAVGEKVQPNPNAMTIATASREGRPEARIVLCRRIDAGAGFVVFYTNYQGRKGRTLASNPFAAAVFHWDALDLQVRIEGPITKSPDAESDAYFAGRPWQSRLSAWASDQSEPIASRADLVAKLHAAMLRLGLSEEQLKRQGNSAAIPRPPHWGGFRLWAERVELWIGGTGRFHDRAAWTRSVAGRPGAADPACGPWSATRLQP